MIDFKVYSHSRDTEGMLRDIIALVLVLGLPFLLFLGDLPLIDPDEGRYAQIPREMLQRGDLITPTLNQVKYFEKPPLLYWINAASLKLFGLTEFAARLPSALCGLLTILSTYVIGRKLYDRRTALIAAFILGTSLGFVLQSRIILTDMLLTFCLTSALGAFIVATLKERRHSSGIWYLFYAFSALAVLAKGLIGFVFPAGIIFLFMLLTKRWHVLAHMRLASGLLLFLAIAAPWFIAVSIRNPEFAQFFFIHEHLERFTSNVHGRYQPFWFFVPVLAGTMLPWSFFIPAAMGKAWRERRHNRGDAGIFLLIWILLIFTFFSKSSSKLIPYMLPIFPPLAMLIASRFSSLLSNRDRGFSLAMLMLGITLTLLGAGAISYAYLPQVSSFISGIIPQLSAPLNRFVQHAPQLAFNSCMFVGVLFCLQGIVSIWSCNKKPAFLLVTLISCSFALELVVPQTIMPEIAQAESPRELALKANQLAGPETRIITFGPMQAVSWYTGKRVMVTGQIDELTFGSKQGDQQAWFPDRQTVLNLWGSDSHVLIMLKQHELNGLINDLNPAPRVVAKGGRRVMISNK